MKVLTQYRNEARLKGSPTGNTARLRTTDLLTSMELLGHETIVDFREQKPYPVLGGHWV